MKFIPTMRNDYYYQIVKMRKEQREWKRADKKIKKLIRKLKVESIMKEQKNKLFHRYICIDKTLFQVCLFKNTVTFLIFSWNRYGILVTKGKVQTSRFLTIDLIQKPA
jgi:hypothetical protein